jgi:hypothetical protein
MLIIYNEFILYLFLILLVDPLTLTFVLSLFNPYINITSQSSLQLFVLFFLIYIIFVIYIVNLPIVRPPSCRVIYYFDTPALGIRHQQFDRVKNKKIMKKQ